MSYFKARGEDRKTRKGREDRVRREGVAASAHTAIVAYV